MKRLIFIIFVAGLIAITSCGVPENQKGLSKEEIKEGFVKLFNGKNLDGWKVYRGPAWHVEEGMLVGPSDSSGWIGTVDEYDNFVLRLEYWIDPGETGWSNSGIFFRADTTASPWVDGYEVQIDLKDEKNPTGSIYNRVPTSLEQVREIAPEKQWNQVEIKAVGPRIQVWINGQQLQDATLHVRDIGHIGVQQHHKGVTVKFKNIRIKKLTLDDAEKGWVSLFNGKNLDGWFIRGKAQWVVLDGILTGIDGMGHIYADPVLSDLEVRGMFRVSENGNSGLYFRANPPEDNPDGFPRGYEAQINNHGDAFTGWLWKPGTPTGPAKRLVTRDNAWFSMRVKAVGDHIQIWVNGQLMTDYNDSEYKEGHFAIQGHNPGMKIEARDLFYRDLSAK